MSDVDHALEQVIAIRSQMAVSTRFRGFAPAIVATTGLLALMAATAQALWPTSLANDPVGFAIFWTAVATMAAGLIATEALQRSYRLHGTMADMMIGGTLTLFLPFGASGALTTVVLIRVAPDACRLLPGLWQMDVALLAFAAASTNLPRSMIWAAGWYLVCATIVLLLAGEQGRATPWMMGLPFGAGQLLTAWLLHRSTGAR